MSCVRHFVFIWLGILAVHFLCAGISPDKAPSGRVGFGAEVLVGGSDRVMAGSSV